MEKNRRETSALVEKVENKLIAIASSETKDRMGDVIRADGWQLKNFKKNPVLLFAHKHTEAPIGLAKNIRVTGKNLIFEPYFHAITQLSREVKEMYEADPPIMRAFSVGFLVLETENNKKAGEDLADSQVISKAELLEISAVPVPANQEALTVASKSITDEEKTEVDKWVSSNIGTEPEDDKGCGCGSPEKTPTEEQSEEESADENQKEEEKIKIYPIDKILYETYKDSDGISRQRAKIECPDCKKIRWVDKRNIDRSNNFTGLCLECLNKKKGIESNAYKGNDTIKNGYILTHDENGKSIYEHRLIMERKIGRKLERWEHVHHLNSIKTDNRIENLELVNDNEHVLIQSLQKRISDLEMIAQIKPYPSEHSCRIQDPGKYKRFARKNCYRKSDGKCIDFIFGITGDGKAEIQSYRYPKDTWTSGAAAAHCKSKGGSFEAAANKAEEEDKQQFECECLECGYTMKTDKHCSDVKCPKCDGEMRRSDRPGPGKDIEGESRGAIPYSVHGDGSKAPETASWDAGAEVKKASGDAAKLKKMHAWVDTSDSKFDASERKWYKLPHHTGDGSQSVVWKGVAAAMGALLGARGGVTIPAGDKTGVYNHLKGHYKQFDKDVPDLKEYTSEELEKMFSIQEETNNESIEVKEGRVLSGKNRKLIQQAVSVLQDLLSATDTPARDGDGKPKKGREEEAHKLLKNRAIVRTLQKFSGDLSSILKDAKTYKK